MPKHGVLVLDFKGDHERFIPLHVSIRAHERRVILNDCVDGAWGEEVSAEYDGLWADTPLSIAIAFLENSIRLILDGRTTLRLRTDRFNLANIQKIRFSEDIPATEIKVNGGPVTALFYSTALELSNDFLVQGKNFDPSRLDQNFHLRVEGLDEPLACWKSAVEVKKDDLVVETASVEAHLPGYVWQRAAEDPSLPIRLQLFSNNIPCSELLEVRKEDVATLLDKLAERGRPEDMIYPALTAVEHVKFAGLLPLLSEKAVDFVRKTVTIFKLEEFFEPEIEKQSNTVTNLAEPKRPSYQSVMQRRFAESVRLDPQAGVEAHLSRLFSPLNGASHHWGQFLISLSEYCCVQGEFDALFQRWIQHSSAAALPKPTNNWGRSLYLPFHLKFGHFAEIAKLLHEMSKDQNDWINTGCIAWTLEQCLTDWQLSVDSKSLSEIVDGFLQLATVQARGYWTRSPCKNLVRASALLLLHRDHLPEPKPAEVLQSTLRSYGLSWDFWQAVEQAVSDRGQSISDHGPEIAAAYSAFTTICQYVERASSQQRPTRIDTEGALRFFRNVGTYEAGRVRIETFGPDALIGDDEANLRTVMQEGDDGDEALIRHLAFPGARHVPAGLSDYSRKAVRRRLAGMAQNTQLRTIEIIADEANRLCRTVQSRADTGTERSQLDSIIRRLQRLPTAPETRLDIGIGLAICGDFLRDGRDDLADITSTFLYREIESLAQNSVKALRSNRMFRGAHGRFRMQVAEASSALPLAVALDSLIQDKIKPTALEPSEPDPAMTKLWINCRGLFDTLVMVYSCRDNLETKVAQARRTWLKRLEGYGIPYLVVVGDGNGTLDGDVLAVDAPDTYEALPQKTLAMLAWAEKHTQFAHVLKVDDDCFLGIEEYFFSLSHRQSNYYGRTLTRDVGSKPRMWHMARSVSRQGQNELDKSPEPSRFADGGSAYSLSREALVALRTVVNSPKGQRLVTCSFSEDKLVGDLLDLVGIRPRSDDYFTAVRRPTRPGGLPVLQWENSFYPSIMSGIKLAHLDTYPDLETCEALYDKGTLYPKKVWPTHRPVVIGSDSQSMELISPEARLNHARQAEVAVGAVVRNEMFMLPHFLRHYRDLGVTAFLMVDNCSDDGTLEYLLEQPDVTVFSAEGSFRQAAQGTDWKVALCAQFRLGKWTLIADTDELLLYPGYETRSFADFVNDPMHGNADAFLSSMIDMFPKGSLSEATFANGGPFIEAGYAEAEALLSTSLGLGSFGNRQTRTSSLRHRLIPGSRSELFVSEKVALFKYKPWMRFTVSMHYAAGVKLAKQSVLLAHFKYNSEFRQKAIREIKRGQYFNNSEEYKKYVDLISEGRDTIYNPETSVPWRQCREVRDVLG